MSEIHPDPIAPLVGGFLVWDGFVAQLRERNRHFPADRGCVDALVSECLERRFVLPAASHLYRARRMPVEAADANDPLPITDMGPPPTAKAVGGRLNPEGISYYYLALEKDTAIAEVRPWIRARVTVATLQARANLELVDLRIGHGPTTASPMLQALAYTLQRPVYPPDEDPFAYLGTQFVAEKLKAEGTTGILYDSGLWPGGTNAALFVGDELIQRLDVELFEVTAVTHKSASLSDPTPGTDLGFR